MKNKILIVLLIVILAIGIAWNYIRTKNNNNNNSSVNIDPATEQEIATPDRIVVKFDSKYYELTSADENYEELIKACRESFNRTEEKPISDVSNLKTQSDFVEFDYDKISKNNIFFFSGDVGTIKMQETDGVVISKELHNSEELRKKFENAVKDKTPYYLNSSTYIAKNNYQYLPATLDFEEIKYEAVYKKEITSLEEYEKITDLYHLEFEKLDIDELLKDNKLIIFLSKYDISNSEVNVGNIKLYFKGEDYITPEAHDYVPVLMVVSKIVNTKCIYYNYDNISKVDNLTGKQEKTYGVIQKQNDDGTYDVGYTLDTPAVSKIKITDNALLRNKELEQGDYVKVDGTIIDFDETTNKNRTYEVNEISITKKSDYEKRLLDELKGKDYLSTAIVSHYESESQYDGYAICQVFIGDNMDTPDGLIKVYYDFYNGETQSYLGNADSPIETNYGVLDYEIVTVHFKEKVSDLNNIHAKTFEFIAD